MSALPQPSLGWFQKNGAMQAANQKTCAVLVGATVIAFASLAGTGGVSDSNFLAKRKSIGYGVGYFHGLDTEAADAARSAAGNLARIRGILKPAVSDLATLFSVTRQTIYNWQGGEQPKDEHLAKLEDLAKAADIIAAEGLANPSQLLKRKISNGKNLLDIIRAGGSASEAAQKLVQTVRREEQQRKMLADRSAGRKRPIISPADFGVPSFTEQG